MCPETLDPRLRGDDIDQLASGRAAVDRPAFARMTV